MVEYVSTEYPGGVCLRMAGDGKSVHSSGNRGVLGVPLATFWGACPQWVHACPQDLQPAHGMHRQREGVVGAGGPWKGVGAFHLISAKLRAEQRSSALSVLVKPLPKARSSNVWLCHIRQKRERGKRRR